MKYNPYDEAPYVTSSDVTPELDLLVDGILRQIDLGTITKSYLERAIVAYIRNSGRAA